MDKVIIAGGGLAGLLLALLLERASIDYVVLERSSVAKMPLEGGGVIWITSQIQPLLQQLGLLDNLRNMSKPMTHFTIIDGSFSFLGYGYHSLSISRPDLYNFLVDHIPPEKILLGKHVIDVRQDDCIATCTCTDNSSYQGIIVGADGAYSNVRLNLYRQLKETNELPACDRRPMRYEYRSLVGMTRPLDPEHFPLIKKEHSDTRVLVSRGKNPFTFWCVPVTQNRVYWMLDELLDEPQDCPDVEDWSGVERAAHEMCEKYRLMKSPLDGILLGELFDLTPRGTIMALPREEGFFSTWTRGKVVLVGDACHKMMPHGGQPFVQAGYDAARLANILYAHSLEPTAMDISVRLRSYEAARQEEAQDAVKESHRFVKVLNQQGWIGTMTRYMVLNLIPKLSQYILGDRMNTELPQVDFLVKEELKK